jgi:EmrB/QacA subfamily drug resistance transporter
VHAPRKARARSPRPTGERRIAAFAGVLLVMLLAALDSTIVATALPTIVSEFGGLTHLSWVVTAYLLAQTVVGPLYGKLGDLYGRKRVLQSAIALFLVGSALCGLSRSLAQLIVFRALQGFGGGGLMVSTQAVIGDIVPPRERGRYQGIFGAVFGVASIAGPLIGGFLTTHLSWRWIFYVNLPLGAIAVVVLAATLPKTERRTRRTVDYAGALLLATTLAAIVLLTDLGGSTIAWTSPTAFGLGAVAIVSLVLFVFVERRATEPVLPLALFGNRVFRIAAGVGLIVGFALFGSVTYLPLFLQVVKGSSPTASGLELVPMMGGMLVTSIVSGQLISRSGRYRLFPIAGTAVMTIGLVLLSRVSPDMSRGALSGCLLALGFGLGMVMQVLVLAVQNAVEYQNLGVATSGATLFRFIGGSVGTAALGAVFSGRLSSLLAARLAGAPEVARLDRAALLAMTSAARDAYVSAFTDALGLMFLVAACVAAVGVALALRLEERPLRETVAAAAGTAEGIPTPSHDDPLTHISRGLWALLSRDAKRRLLERVIARSGLDVSPAAAWLLGRLSGEPALDVRVLARARDIDEARLVSAIADLEARGWIAAPDGVRMLTERGRAALDQLVQARRAAVAELLAGWSPHQHRELAKLLRYLAKDLAAEAP